MHPNCNFDTAIRGSPVGSRNSFNSAPGSRAAKKTSGGCTKERRAEFK